LGVVGKIEKFEDIQAWQKTRELVKQVYKITKNTQFAKDFSLRDQVYVGLDQGYISENDFYSLDISADEVSRMIQGFSNYLKNCKTL
jgi:hypothetical protein